MQKDDLYSQLLDRPYKGKTAEQKPYVLFTVEPTELNDAVYDSGRFDYKVLAFDSENHRLSLPDGIKKFFVEREAAWAVKMCLDVLALGKTKRECDVWSQFHKKGD